VGSGPEPSTVLEFARFLFSRVQSVAFLLVMTVLSAGSALVEGMVFLFFAKDLEASNTLLGITVAVTVSFEIPLFYMGAWLHRALSGTSMLLVAMACYCSRVYYYTLVGKEHAWYVLLLEPLHGVTYALSASASVSEMSRLAPPHLQATGQSFLSVARMIGSVIGTVGGGYVMQHHGSLVLYRGAAVIVAVAAVLYGLTMRCVGTGTDEST
jgi:predicted MFS family arabinose efflux permease